MYPNYRFYGIVDRSPNFFSDYSVKLNCDKLEIEKIFDRNGKEKETKTCLNISICMFVFCNLRKRIYLT